MKDHMKIKTKYQPGNVGLFLASEQNYHWMISLLALSMNWPLTLVYWPLDLASVEHYCSASELEINRPMKCKYSL